MQSAFGPKRGNPQATAQPAVEETYDLRGLDFITPDELMVAGRSPWTINSRMRARNDGENRVANRTRKGSGHLSTPVGQTTDVQNVTTNTGDLAFTTTSVIAQPIVFNNPGALTRLDTNLKKLAGSTGHVIVEIWTNNGGVPGTLIAQGSTLANLLTTSYQYLTAYFIDAPIITVGPTYWAVYYIQDNGTGTYYLVQTAQVGSADLLSNNVGGSWSTVAGSIQYKTYLSTPGGVKGHHLRYPSDGNNRIIFAQGTSVYAVPKNTGVATAFDTGLNSAAAHYRFCQAQDMTIYCNSFDPLRWWNGTDTPTNLGGVPTTNPSHAILWKNRLFVVSAGNRVDFSDLLNYESYPSVNFFYVPDPKSPDLIAGVTIFQDNLVILTHKTKHIIIGSDISNFTRKESVGTKGALSQEAITSDRNYVYFMSDDLMVYRWNGVSDTPISDVMQPEFQGISDPSSVRLSIYRNQLRVSYAKTPSATANRTALFDTQLQEWFLDTDHPVSGYDSLYLDRNELVEFSSVVGRIYYGEAQGSDLGKKIDWKYWTAYKTYAYRRRNGQTFGGGSAKKRIKRFHPVVRIQSANYTMYVGKDMNFNNTPDMRPYTVSGGGATWGGGGKWGDGSKYGSPKQLQNRTGMSGRGEHLQYRFERKGVETPVELYGYIAQYKIGKQK
jgi:hypothetical protein